MFKSTDYTNEEYDVVVDDEGMLHFIKRIEVYADSDEDEEQDYTHLIEYEVRKCEAVPHIYGPKIESAYDERKKILARRLRSAEVPADLTDIADKVRRYIRENRIIVHSGNRTKDVIENAVRKVVPITYEVSQFLSDDPGVYAEILGNTVDLYYVDEVGNEFDLGTVQFQSELLPRRKYEDRKWLITA